MKFALVTGASKGVGKGIALELAREGFAIAVNYNRDRAGAESTVEEIRAAGGDADAFQADVGVSGDVARMFEAYDARFPKIDCLVNNAGIQTWSTLLDLKEEDWDRVIATNLKGTFLCTQQAGRRMKDSGGGTIVNIGSGCNKWPFPRLVDYTASKGGIEQFTKVAAVELGRYKVRVNCVAPGAIEIERTKEEGGDYAALWAREAPLGRVGVPEDVAGVVAFLASDKAGFVTGQTLWVDGGAFTRPTWPYGL